MVGEQLRGRGISDRRVLEAMGSVPRERFVPVAERLRAYADAALGIAHGQTISQPWIVAAICQGLALGGKEAVLEVGTGSGYSAAILGRLARRVLSIERIAPLSLRASELLAELGIGNVELRVGDGSLGAPDSAPFEAIAVHAALPRAPRTLLRQLAPGARLVAPVIEGHDELLMGYRRLDDADDPEQLRLETEVIASCRFVPLIGREGFADR